MEENTRNKEVVENKFLIERLLHKLLESGKITQKDVPDLKWKFRKELLLHETKPPKERLQILVALFKDSYKRSDVSENIEEAKQQAPSPSSIFQASTPDTSKEIKTERVAQAHPKTERESSDNIPQTSQPENVAPKESVGSDHIGSIVEKVLMKDSVLTPDLRQKAREYILDDTVYLRGVEMNDVVIARMVERSLERFKERMAPEKEAVVHDEAVAVQETVPKQELEGAPNSAVSAAASIQSETSSNMFVSPPKPEAVVASDLPQQEAEKQIEKVSIPSQVVKTLEEKEVRDEITQNTTAQPSVKTVSDTGAAQTQMPPQAPVPPKQQQDDAPVFKTNVTSQKDTQLSNADGKKSLAEIIMEQARAEDMRNPLVSHQEAIEKPPKPYAAKKPETPREPEGKVTIIEEMSPKVPQGTDIPVPRPQDGSPEDLASASNTKMTFHRDVTLSDEQILQRHDVRKQQLALFDKYLTEQIQNLMKVAQMQGITNEEWLTNTREEVKKEAYDLVEGVDESISDKIHRLDVFFEKKRSEVAQHQPVENRTTIEEMVDSVMVQAGAEVRTEDGEADARFRDTLRDTLHFKAKHLMGVGMETPKIQVALNEEYAKHKAFYLKSVK
jgi:hypothetical protein